jgi:hypothetical protein
MKDCTSCPHRAEINPQYADMPYEEIACSSCKLTEPPRHGMIEYGDQFEHPSENTWAIIDAYDSELPTEGAAQLTSYLMASDCDRAFQRMQPPNDVVKRFVGVFKASQEPDIIDAVMRWHRTLEANGRDRGRSRVAQHKAMRKIKAVIASLTEVESRLW